MAKKDPAFLFYSEKWLQGTASFLPEEKGVYIDLLAHQHQDKDLPTDLKRLARMVGLHEDDFLPIWEVIKVKFIINANNRLVNHKLTEITTERLTKSITNTITGIFASIIRLSDVPHDLKEKVKKDFKIEPFLPFPKQMLNQKITEWYTERLRIGYEYVININSIKYSSKVKQVENGKSEFSGNFKAQGEELMAKRLRESTAAINENREKDN